jgi:hypothetical protein
VHPGIAVFCTLVGFVAGCFTMAIILAWLTPPR